MSKAPFIQGGGGCTCESCKRPLPLVTVRTAEEAAALNALWAGHRRAYREDHPIVTRVDLAEDG